MVAYVTRRLLSGLFLLLALSLVAYVVFYTIPVNPGCQVVPCGPHSNTTPAQLAAANHSIGADRPVLVQYGHFLWNLAWHGSLGKTFAGDLPVRSLLADALPVTGSIVLGGAVLLLLLAIPLGTMGALRPGTALDRSILLVSLLGIVFHPFVIGIILRNVFSGRVHLAPPAGYCPLHGGDSPCNGIAAWSSHLALPWVTFALFFLPLYVRMIRSRILETVAEPYVMVARAKGASEIRVVRSHLLRTAMPPIVALLAIDLGTAVTAAIYIETVFGMPGIGYLALHSLSGEIGGYDLPTIVGIVVVVSMVVLIFNLVADIITAALDPRIRLRRSAGLMPLPRPVARVAERAGRIVPPAARAGIAVAGVAALVVLIVLTHRQGGANKITLTQEPRQTIRLGWDDTVTFSGQVGMRVRFHMLNVAVGKRTWVVKGEIENRSDGPLSMLPPQGKASSQETGPSLLVPRVDSTSDYQVDTHSASPTLQVVPATVVDPPFPRKLGKGERWTGTFAGSGRIPHQTLIFMALGMFQNADGDPVSWNSADSFRIQ